MLRPFCISLLLFSFICSFAQTVVTNDQLKAKIFSAKNSTEKINALLVFCEQWDSYSPDTLKKYTTELKQMAQAQNDHRTSLIADYYYAAWLLQKNELDSALAISKETFKHYQKTYSYDDMWVKMYGLRGNILLRTTKMDELMSMNFEWMKLSEQHHDTLGLARAIIGLGNVNSRLKKYTETMQWYRQALNLMKISFLQRKLSLIYNNIAIVFYHLNEEKPARHYSDSALYYVAKGVQLSKEDGNLTNLCNALSIQGGLYAEYKRLKEAEASFRQEIEVRKQIGDVYYLIADMAQVALFYSNTDNPQKGVDVCKEALVIAEKNGNDYQSLNSIYSSLGKCYWAANDYKGYSEALLKQMDLKDSIYQKSSAEAMAEMETKYNVQKNETTIAKQKLELVSKNYQVYGSLALLLLAIVASYIVLQQYRRKQKLRLQFVQEEEKRKSEKAVADAEEAERKRIAADLHDSLGAYAASITSNIDHLRVKQTDASGTVALEELRNNSMAIVSQLSDTIWALKKDALSLTTISDRIKIFVQRIQPSYPNITIDIFENINTDHLLAPSQAFHLFQIIKEAINNALRHSRCTYLFISIKGDLNWRIDISDNGSGMREVTITEGGSGLLNMMTRAKESGWKIEWQNNKPKGTHVIIEPTTN